MEEDYESIMEFKPRKLSEKTASEEFQETVKKSIDLFTPTFVEMKPKKSGYKRTGSKSPGSTSRASPTSRSPERRGHPQTTFIKKNTKRQGENRRRFTAESETSSEEGDENLIKECLVCLERNHRNRKLDKTEESREIERRNQILDHTFIRGKKTPIPVSQSAKPPPPPTPKYLKSLSDAVTSRTPMPKRRMEIEIRDTPLDAKPQRRTSLKETKDKRNFAVTFRDGGKIDQKLSRKEIAPSTVKESRATKKQLKKPRKPIEIVTLPEPTTKSIEVITSEEFQESLREPEIPRFEIITLPDTSTEQRIWEEKRTGLLTTPFQLPSRRSALTDLNNLHDQCPPAGRTIHENDLKNLVLDTIQAKAMAQQIDKMQSTMEHLQTIVKKYHSTESYREDINFILANIDKALAETNTTISTNT